MITIETPESALTARALAAFLRRARLATGLRGDVDVLLTTDATLRRLNREFRGKNKPTDVLSFSSPPAFAGQHAGDLAISIETAARQAATYNHPLSAEIKILLLHGLLHLTGLDHETDQGEMATRESLLRAELRLPNTLIERSIKPPSKSPQITSKKPQLHHKKPSRNPRKPASSLPKGSSQKKTAPSRRKAAVSATAVERPPHFVARATTRSKRGGK